MIIGDRFSFYYDFSTDKWTSGPDLRVSRHGHACGHIKVKNELMIIAVGGIDPYNNLLKSNELLENSHQPRWTMGPYLVEAMCHMAIVSYENFAIMLGGSTSQEEKVG